MPIVPHEIVCAFRYNYVLYAIFKVFKHVKLKKAVSVESLYLVQSVGSFLTDYLHTKLWLIRLSHASAFFRKHCAVSGIVYSLTWDNPLILGLSDCVEILGVPIKNIYRFSKEKHVG
jgi:hypothetical protein